MKFNVNKIRNQLSEEIANKGLHYLELQKNDDIENQLTKRTLDESEEAFNNKHVTVYKASSKDEDIQEIKMTIEIKGNK